MGSIQFLVFSMTLCLALSATANICSEKDTREFSYYSEVGRLNPKKALDRRGRPKDTACTVSLISKSCGITAGHCSKFYYKAEFNVPHSVNRKIRHAAPQDTYLIDQDRSKHIFEGAGNDWGVVKFKPNKITGKLPGEVQGFLELSWKPMNLFETVFIAGYGLDYRHGERNFTQQVLQGAVVKVENNILYHNVDTSGGSSGSAIRSASTGRVIGINTHGGCGTKVNKFNRGSILSALPELYDAVEHCFASER